MGQAQQKRRAVLIVEDDAELRSLTAALFDDEEVDTIECESAEAALAILLIGGREVAMIFAGTNGLLDDLEVADCRPFEQYLYRFLDTSHPTLLQKIRDRKTIDDEIKVQLQKVIKEAKERFKNERGRAA